MSADGAVIAEQGDIYGEALKPHQLPKVLVAAVLAIEDRRFFSHIGIDPIGITRAAIENIRAGGIEQGGSTITQHADSDEVAR